MTMQREVFVIGVGMHRFGKHDVPRRAMHYAAGIAALEDAHISFRDVGALYSGYIGGSMLDGVTFAKDLGLTGLPVVDPVRFGAEGVTVETIALDGDGGLRPTGQMETLPVDSLVLALGQHAEIGFLRKVAGIAVGRDDSVLVDGTLMTGRPGIFAGGDVIGGLRTMTAATGHGKKAARAIDAWLRGEVHAPGPKAPPVDFAMLNLPLFLDAGRARPSELPVEARIGFAEVVGGIDARQARFEAARCLSCGNCFTCDNCLAACPEQAIVKLGKGRKYAVDLDLCSGCAVCFDQCPCHAIEMIPEPASADGGPRPARFKLRA